MGNKVVQDEQSFVRFKQVWSYLKWFQLDLNRSSLTLILESEKGSNGFELVLVGWDHLLWICFLRFHWLKGSGRHSNATVQWFIPDAAPSGRYRIRHFGHFKEMKNFRPIITAYEGASDEFTVSSSYYVPWLCHYVTAPTCPCDVLHMCSFYEQRWCLIDY